MPALVAGIHILACIPQMAPNLSMTLRAFSAFPQDRCAVPTAPTIPRAYQTKFYMRQSPGRTYGNPNDRWAASLVGVGVPPSDATSRSHRSAPPFEDWKSGPTPQVIGAERYQRDPRLHR